MPVGAGTAAGINESLNELVPSFPLAPSPARRDAGRILSAFIGTACRVVAATQRARPPRSQQQPMLR